MNEYQYLYNGTYHSDTSEKYMTALGIDEETQDSIINQKAFEAEQSKQDEINLAKSYLLKTDWIIAKIAECNALGDDVSTLTAKYSDELSGRESARIKINELED